MKQNEKTIIYTELDGTFLDKKNYSFLESLPPAYRGLAHPLKSFELLPLSIARHADQIGVAVTNEVTERRFFSVLLTNKQQRDERREQRDERRLVSPRRMRTASVWPKQVPNCHKEQTIGSAMMRKRTPNYELSVVNLLILVGIRLSLILSILQRFLLFE